ncbi:MAG: CRISPR-associated helicase Cas3' [Bilifractor sp.]|jgi:CRISPR-associated endonuclease/helicase Cas3
MNYIAHIKENIGQIREKNDKFNEKSVQTVQEHLESTAELAENFSIPEFKSLLYNCGLLHDIGKYQKEFQNRIRGSMIRVDHSTSGAIEAGNLFQSPAAWIMQYIIAGHHSGIPDGGTMDCSDESSLSARVHAELPTDVIVYKKEITPRPFSETDNRKLAEFLTQHIQEKDKQKLLESMIDEFAFAVRYCYSCLVDADSLDTEHFCRDIERKTLHSDFSLCLDRLNSTFNAFSLRKKQTPLQKARTRLQKQAYENIRKDADIYLMNMPTGSGKTLCSAKCALIKALAEKKHHIIYIIPYNSIISQTANEFEKIFNPDGKEKAANILRHQSTYSIEDDENADDNYKMRVNQATENWDADIIITTAVQFFETVFSNRRGKLRKMHNMADSVLIFDEAHLMPVEYFQPCLESIAYLTKMFRSKAIMLTATMPDYKNLLTQYTFHDLKVISLIPDHSDFALFRKCEYHDLGKITFELLSEKARTASSALIVVNSRNTARELYNFFGGIQRENLYHLSTYMTKYDLGRTIDEIKSKLEKLNCEDGKQKSAESLLVISTSLIEAGVDLDFQTAFREYAGIDSILQTGGRCNREGKRSSGNVYVFEVDQNRKRADDIKTAVTKDLMKKEKDIASMECIQEYFHRIYECNEDELARNSMHSFMGNPLDFASIPFRSYEARLIDSTDESILIPENEEAVSLIQQMEYQGISRTLMRKAQKYTCSVPQKAMADLLQQGVIQEVSGGSHSGGVFALTNPKYYNDYTGIQFEGGDYFI